MLYWCQSQRRVKCLGLRLAKFVPYRIQLAGSYGNIDRACQMKIAMLNHLRRILFKVVLLILENRLKQQCGIIISLKINQTCDLRQTCANRTWICFQIGGAISGPQYDKDIFLRLTMINTNHHSQMSRNRNSTSDPSNHSKYPSDLFERRVNCRSARPSWLPSSRQVPWLGGPGEQKNLAWYVIRTWLRLRGSLRNSSRSPAE